MKNNRNIILMSILIALTALASTTAQEHRDERPTTRGVLTVSGPERRSSQERADTIDAMVDEIVAAAVNAAIDRSLDFDSIAAIIDHARKAPHDRCVFKFYDPSPGFMYDREGGLGQTATLSPTSSDFWP